MIYGELEQIGFYSSLGKQYAKAFSFLQTNDIVNFPDGRYEIDGNAVFANISDAITRAPLELQLENHRKYVDLQMIVNGEEHIFVDFTSALTLKEQYCEERDIEFYSAGSTRTAPLPLSPGRFILLWPGEAHAPCISVSDQRAVRRVVVKILVTT